MCEKHWLPLARVPSGDGLAAHALIRNGIGDSSLCGTMFNQLSHASQGSSPLKKFQSGQVGDVGRNPSLPPTTKRRKTTNLKSINNQKCQKIKLHGTLTTMELKKQTEKSDQ